MDTKIQKPKMLVVAPSVPKPDVASGDLRFFTMLQVLAKNSIIDFLIWEDHHSPGAEDYKRRLEKIGVNVLRHGTLGLDQAVLRRVYDIVFFEFWHCAAPCLGIMRRQQPQALIVIDSVDIHFVREEAGLAFGISEASMVRANKQNEVHTYQQADLVVIVTQEDRQALIAEQVATPLVAVPNIVPFYTRQAKPRSPELLFVGGFRHPPNRDGLLWFIGECWSSVRARVPDARLTVVGSNTPQEIKDFNGKEGIEVAGFVPDTKPYLERAFLSIAPLRFGAGMKGKVTEAMAAGLPVVTTTFGAQGLGAVAGKHLLVADDPETFSNHIANMLTQPERAEEMGLAGQQHIEQLCSITVVEKQLNEMISFLIAKRATGRQPPSVLAAFGHKIAFATKVLLLCVTKSITKPYDLIKKTSRPKQVSIPKA